MSLEQLENIRRFELKAVIALINQEAEDGARVLDIGAGTGWQAQVLTDSGYAVEAIDMTTSTYVHDRVFPIRDYDGRHIPFHSATFDVIYSSNVLEHVAHAEAFQKEIHRVLKPDGVVIHVVPSGSWRFWSNLGHYPYIARRAAERLLGAVKPTPDPVATAAPNDAARPRRWSLARVFIPHRDGEVGNALTEIYHFSRWRWRDLFHRTGWSVESRVSNRLFYTAYYLLNSKLPIATRSRLSRLMGGSCHVFLLRPASSSETVAARDTAQPA